MNLIEQINLLFDNFQDPACRCLRDQTRVIGIGGKYLYLLSR